MRFNLEIGCYLGTEKADWKMTSMCIWSLILGTWVKTSLYKRNWIKSRTTDWSTQRKACHFLGLWVTFLVFSAFSFQSPFMPQNKYLDVVHNFCPSAVTAAHLNSSCNSENLQQHLFFQPTRWFLLHSD